MMHYHDKFILYFSLRFLKISKFNFLQLDQDVSLSPAVSFVKLPSRKHKAGERVTIVGFGAIHFSSSAIIVPKYKQVYRALILDYNECHAKYRGENKIALQVGQLCTFAAKGVGTCHVSVKIICQIKVNVSCKLNGNVIQ